MDITEPARDFDKEMEAVLPPVPTIITIVMLALGIVFVAIAGIFTILNN